MAISVSLRLRGQRLRDSTAATMTPDPRQLLRQMFDAAVARAMPDKCVPPFLPMPPKGRTLVVGAGKASASMAKAVEDHWRGGDLSGLIVTRYGHRVPCRQIEI